MSETQTEKETEVVAGTIGGVTLKREGTWTVSVTPEGSQYSKNLWTKDAELVESLGAKLGQQGAFVCNASYYERDGKRVRSLWIDRPATSSDPPAGEVGHRFPIPKPTQNGKPDVDWDAKERRDYRSRAWAQTLGAFTHTIKTDEDPQEVFLRLQPFQRKIYEDVTQSFAYPGDESDIPF